MTKHFKREQKPQRPRLFSNEVGGGGGRGWVIKTKSQVKLSQLQEFF